MCHVLRLTIFLGLLSPFVLVGCSRNKAETLTAKPAAPQQQRRVPLTSNAAIVVSATVGDQPGEVLVSLLNQTDKAVEVDGRYFALIMGPRRTDLRPFDPAVDEIVLATRILPPEDQQSFLLRFTLQPMRSLDGVKLVFNPEPLGIPASFGVVEPRRK